MGIRENRALRAPTQVVVDSLITIIGLPQPHLENAVNQANLVSLKVSYPTPSKLPPNFYLWSPICSLLRETF